MYFHNPSRCKYYNYYKTGYEIKYKCISTMKISKFRLYVSYWGMGTGSVTCWYFAHSSWSRCRALQPSLELYMYFHLQYCYIIIMLAEIPRYAVCTITIIVRHSWHGQSLNMPGSDWDNNLSFFAVHPLFLYTDQSVWRNGFGFRKRTSEFLRWWAAPTFLLFTERTNQTSNVLLQDCNSCQVHGLS